MEDVLVPLGMFAMVAFIVYVKAESSRRRHQQATEFHARILDRMGSAREFGEFLATDAGGRFLDAIASEGRGPQLRVLRLIQLGITLLALGVGLLVANQYFPDRRTLIGGVIAASIGLGSLLSAAISFKLLPRLGLGGLREPASSEQRTP